LKEVDFEMKMATTSSSTARVL
jgi:hypothetical protein